MSRAPFPTHLLPGAVREFVEAEAEALGCDPSMVALPALAALAGAVGASRAIEAKSGWPELPIVWGVVIAPSGTLKSPAMSAALAPLHTVQAERLREHEAAEAEHALAVARHEQDLRTWKNRAEGDPPAAPVAPEPSRILIGDTTLEALAPILRANPRGVLLVRDELSAWIRAFDAYRKGRGGDCEAWQGCWQGQPMLIDRKTGERRTLHVPRAVVSICGTTQPGTFERVMGGEHAENGLVARLLVAAPETRAARWTDATTSQAVCYAYERTLRGLLRLSPAMDPAGDPEPLTLPLTPDAQAEYAHWFNTRADRIDEAGDGLRAALAKLRGYGLRLALLTHLARDVERGGDGRSPVTPEALRAGCALADWFADEAARVYGLLSESDAERDQRVLVEWIKARGGETTVRDLQKDGPIRFRGAGVARRALDDLEAGNFGFWVPEQPLNTRKPPVRFRLLDRVMAGDWPPFPEHDAPGERCDTSDATATKNPAGDAGRASVAVSQCRNGLERAP